jgi:hypothetical protein
LRKRVASTVTGSTARRTNSSAAASLTLQTLGRQDLLCTKLVALVDRGTDYDDCVALQPTVAELHSAWPFIEQYEGNEESRVGYWVPLAKKQLNRLAKELGHDVVF